MINKRSLTRRKLQGDAVWVRADAVWVNFGILNFQGVTYKWY